MIQIIGFAIAHNRRINFGHLIMEEIIKNQLSVRETYYLYPIFLQTVLEHRLTTSQLSIYQRSRMIEPPILSLRPAMVLLNNAHYPNVVLPARLTNHIHNFFDVIDQVVPDVQVQEEEEEDEDPEAGGAEASGEGEEEENNDQISDSNNDKSEYLDIDHPEASGVHKSPEDEIMPQDEVAEEEYNHGQ